jgi:NhaA family Na+:H+ antiporter
VNLNLGLGRILANERNSATILVPVAATALVLAHFKQLNFFADQWRIFGTQLHITEWISEGPLAIFFFVAGLEVRREFNSRKLNEKKLLILPAVGAFTGMLVPALIYIGLTNLIGISSAGWGIPMATDLPLALAALTLITPRSQGSKANSEHYRALSQVRTFILLLAIADDVGSIIVIAIRFHQKISLTYALLTVLSLGAFAWATSRSKFAILEFLFALISWWFCLKSGIHPTVLGVALGLLTRHTKSKNRLALWEPLSGFFVIPLFIFSSLAIAISWPSSHESKLTVVSLVVSRIVGKPVGIVGGILLFSAITNIKWQIPKRYLGALGMLGGFGFSVSLLFVNLSPASVNQNTATFAIILTLPIALIGWVSYYLLTKATAA